MNLTPEEYIYISNIIKSLNKLMFNKTLVEHNNSKYHKYDEQISVNIYDKNGLLYSGIPPCLGESVNGDTVIVSELSILNWVYRSLYKDVTCIEVTYNCLSYVDGNLRYKTDATLRLNDLRHSTIDEIEYVSDCFRYWDDNKLTTTEKVSLTINKDTNSYSKEIIEHTL